MSGVTRVDELLGMSRRMAERLEELQRGSADMIGRLASKVSATNEFLRPAGDIAKV